MASQEFIKYAPLEVTAVHQDHDLDLWEDLDMEEEPFSDEIEMEHTVGSKVI